MRSLKCEALLAGVAHDLLSLLTLVASPRAASHRTSRRTSHRASRFRFDPLPRPDGNCLRSTPGSRCGVRRQLPVSFSDNYIFPVRPSSPRQGDIGPHGGRRILRTSTGPRRLPGLRSFNREAMLAGSPALFSWLTLVASSRAASRQTSRLTSRQASRFRLDPLPRPGGNCLRSTPGSRCGVRRQLPVSFSDNYIFPVRPSSPGREILAPMGAAESYVNPQGRAACQACVTSSARLCSRERPRSLAG